MERREGQRAVHYEKMPVSPVCWVCLCTDYAAIMYKYHSCFDDVDQKEDCATFVNLRPNQVTNDSLPCVCSRLFLPVDELIRIGESALKIYHAIRIIDVWAHHHWPREIEAT